MTEVRDSRGQSLEVIRTHLVTRLRERSSEIEKAIFARVRNLAESFAGDDPEYVEGLHNAVGDAVAYGLLCIEQGAEWPVPVPAGVAAQARRSARHGVRLDTVLRRYIAGNKLLEEFVMREADDVPSAVLRQILREHGPQVDRLIEAVSTEYREELERTRRSSTQKRAERLLRLLAEDGSDDNLQDFDYDFSAWHVGMVLAGDRVEVALRAFAAQRNYRLLHAVPDQGIVWGWLGSARAPDIADLERYLLEGIPEEISMAIGDPRLGLDGWRLTHGEARAAWQVMQHRPQRLTRGSDVALLASVLRDETLARSLLETYLAPLAEHGNSGQVFRETLRAYFSAGGNAAAAAAALGVNRHTVQRRIRTVEQVLGRHLQACYAELEVALELDDLNGIASKIGRDQTSRPV
jgi:hypothetical protein